MRAFPEALPARLVGSSLLLLLALALPGSAQPWTQPGPFQGNSAGYARDLLSRYRDLRATIKSDLAEIDELRRTLSPYTSVGKVAGGIGIASQEPLTVQRKVMLEGRVRGFEQRAATMEREWSQWCEWGLRLGPLTKEIKLVRDCELDRTTFPATRRYNDLDAIEYRIRHFLEGQKPPEGEPKASDDLATICSAGDGTVTRAKPEELAGGLKPGTRLLTRSGSFSPAEGRNVPIVDGPVPVPAACRVRGYVKGTPPVPPVWSLGDWNTSLSLTFEPRLGAGWGTGQGLLVLSGQHEDNELTAECDIPCAGRITAVFGPPSGHGPLSAGYFEQSFTAYIEVVSLLPASRAAGGEGIREGDSIRAGRYPTIVRLRDGTVLVVKPGAQVTITEPEPGITRIQLDSGSCRVTSWGKDKGRAVEVTWKGGVLRPRGTDFVVSGAGESGRLQVLDGAVTYTSGSGKLVTVSAGEQAALFGDEVTPLAEGERAAIGSDDLDGVPIASDAIYDLPQAPYGTTEAGPGEGPLPEGWLWEDPGQDATLDAPAPGAVHVIAPSGNDLWQDRSSAPRMLRKIAGDFDLEAEAVVPADAANWGGLDFIVKALGSGQGVLTQQMSGLGQDYWIPTTCWGKPPGVPICAPRWMDPGDTNRWAPIPAGPLRVRLSRRGMSWYGARSLDGGTTWELASIATAELPETLWVGWVVRRYPFDGQPQIPTDAVVRDIRLTTAPLGLMEAPVWLTGASAGASRADERGADLSLDGSALGSAQAISGEAFPGDFDVAVSYDCGSLPQEPGTSPNLTLNVTTPDLKTRHYVGVGRSDQFGPARCHSDMGIDGRWGRYTWTAGAEAAGKLRIARTDGVIRSYFWKDGNWQRVSQNEDPVRAPLRLMLFAENGWVGLTPAALRVSFRFDSVQGGPAYPSAMPPEEQGPEDGPGDTETVGPGEPVGGDGLPPLGPRGLIRKLVVAREVRDGAAVDPAEAFPSATSLAACFDYADAPAGSTLAIVWLRGDEEIGRDVTEIDGAGTGRFTLETRQRGGFPPGEYEARLLLGEGMVGRSFFRIGGEAAVKPGPAAPDRIALEGPAASKEWQGAYDTGDFWFCLEAEYTRPGTLLDTTGIDAAPTGSFGLRIDGDGSVSFSVYAPGTRSEADIGNGWHVVRCSAAAQPGQPFTVTVERRQASVELTVKQGTTVGRGRMVLATPLSGATLYLGDYPGDEHWGAGYAIHAGITGSVRVLEIR